VTARDLAEIYQVRSALEAEAFRALALQRHLPPAAVQAAADLSRLNSRSPQRQVVEADLGFHSAIVAGTGNQRLTRAHQALRGGCGTVTRSHRRSGPPTSTLASD
jgi:DNA-binding GntR family transcriptional regulator